MPRRRLAVALLLPEPIAVEVDGLRRALGDKARERVPPHITLVPPVNVREEDIGMVLGVLRTAAAATDALTLHIGPPATFHPVNPVVYLTADDASVRALRDRVFVEPLARTLTHDFVPHVTVADECTPDRIASAVAALADFEVDVPFEAVYLLEEKSPGRYRWNPIADARFEPPRTVGRGGYELSVWRSSLADPEVAPLIGVAAPAEVVAARHDGAVVGALRAEVKGEEVSVVTCAADDDLARLLLAAVEPSSRS